MEEKNSIKVSLGTVICMFIIFILIIALLGMWYYYNHIKVFDDVLNPNNVLDNVDNNTQYSEIAKKLENGNLLLVEDSSYNSDNTYTLKGPIIEVVNKGENEYPSYQKTSKYMQITIPVNTKCTYITDEPAGENATDTVQNVFSSNLYYGGGIGPCFNFEFENGKCISVYEVPTGH